MKNDTKLHDPVNYNLLEQDLDKIENFDSLLNSITDVPASSPLHNISITNAGIYNQKVMIYIKDIENRNSYVPVLCDINLGVDLESNRGIHMSRCVQAIFELSTKKFKNLDEFTIELAKTIREKQKS